MRIGAVFILSAIVLLLTVSGLLAIGPQLESAQPVSKKAEEVYENVQVLRGMPYHQMIPTMQLVSEMLGVECEYCHERDRAAETKPAKQTARRMFEMVRAINRDSFGSRQVISCYSCHQGQVATVNVPDWRTLFDRRQPSDLDRLPQDSGSGAGGRLQTVEAVLDRYQEVLGGQDTLERITSRIETGTLTAIRPDRGPTTLPFQTFAIRPDKRFTQAFTISHLGNTAEAYGVYSGRAGWMREGRPIVRVMFGWRLDAAHLEDTLNLPLEVERVVQDRRLEGVRSVEDRPAYLVSGRTEYLPRVELYFDVDSGLLIRLVHFTQTVVGTFPTQTDYSDYRVVDGLRVPFRWDVTVIRGVQVTYRLDEVRHNVPIEESRFALPDPPPVLYR